MITKRDQDMFNEIEEFHVMTSSQIFKLFFADSSKRYSQLRLQHLTDEGFLKRTRSTINNDYAYYIDKKPLQVHHDLIRSELYVNLKQRYEVLEWNNEVTIANIRPDAMTYIKDHGIIFPVCVEVHLSNQFNFDKYIHLIKENDLKAMFGLNPRVIICTDRDVKIPPMSIKFKVIDLKMDGLNTLFK